VTSAFRKGFAEGFTFSGESAYVLIISILLGLVYVVGVGSAYCMAKLGRKQCLPLTRKSQSNWIIREKLPANHYRQF